MSEGKVGAAHARALYPGARRPFLLPTPAGWLLPPFFTPACSRYLLGCADPCLGITLQGKVFWKALVLGRVLLGLLLSSDRVCCHQLSWIPCSLVLVPAGLRRCPSPKGPGDWHPGEGVEAHLAPSVGRKGGSEPLTSPAARRLSEYELSRTGEGAEMHKNA